MGVISMVRMSPREGSLFGVDVVRLAPNLYMYNSTHQDVSFHGEGRSKAECVAQGMRSSFG